MINRWGHGEEGKKNKHINVGGGDNSCRKPHAMQAPGSQLADRTGHAKITADAILPAMINSRRSRCRRWQEIAISMSWERLDTVATWWIAVGGGTNLVEEVEEMVAPAACRQKLAGGEAVGILGTTPCRRHWSCSDGGRPWGAAERNWGGGGGNQARVGRNTSFIDKGHVTQTK